MGATCSKKSVASVSEPHGGERDGSFISLKVICVGAAGVGKTAIFRRFVRNEFSPEYVHTCQVDLGLKYFSGETNVVVELWDVPCDYVGDMSSVYMDSIDGGIIVTDTTDPISFREIPLWTARVNEYNTSRAKEFEFMFDQDDDVNQFCPFLLLANKSDSPSSMMNADEVKDSADAFHLFGG